MVEPILIKKDPHRNEHLPYKNYDPEIFQRVIDFVDLEDLTEFILSLNTERWVPSCYWKNKGKDIQEEIWYGELCWAIFSYLVTNKLLIIEDQYFGYNPSRTDKYVRRWSYFNTLEKELYIPIRDRLLEEKWFDISRVKDYVYSKGYYYKIGKTRSREDKLNQILDN